MKKFWRSVTCTLFDENDKKAIQTGTRKYPGNPLAKQHHRKPGIESEIEPRPMFINPDYRGSGKLEDKVALITGGDSGIGRSVAVHFAREGADVAIVYLAADSDAEETRRIVEEDEGRRCILIKGDVSDSGFCSDAVKQTVKKLGKLDVLGNNAAFQEHAESLEELTDEHIDLTFKTNPADKPADKLKDFGNKTAFRRPAQPEEVAPAYVFLASPITGSYITGLVPPVIGGVVGAMSSQKE